MFYFKKGKNTTETQEKICAVCGKGAVTDQMRQKWFVKFHAGDFSLDHVPLSGGPVEVDGDQIKTLIENNKHYTRREIANVLKIFTSMKLLVKMKNVSFTLQKKLNGIVG